MSLATASQELALLLEEATRRKRRRWLDTLYPSKGPLRRERYPKHIAFFRAGADYRIRLFMAAHRIGKTIGTGCAEISWHMTGQYPPWWKGRRFSRPTRWWAAGQTAKTARDVLQAALLGEMTEPGTGTIPGDTLLEMRPKAGLADAIEIIRVRHRSGGISSCMLKSYDQGMISFTGTSVDGILLDEEPPLPILAQSLLRTMTTHGLLMLTWTPLYGLSETILHFLPDGVVPPDGPLDASTYLVNASWDDAPHLSQATKEAFLAALPPYLRDAASRGLPILAEGAIYPVPENDWLIDPFEIPAHWRRVYALDVGWNRTAALWGAYDSETDIWYWYREHYRGEAEPSVHAAAIRASGAWIPGVIDPAARGRSQVDGAALYDLYRDLGLDLEPYDNTVEAGIYAVWERKSTGRIKVFRSLENYRKEARLYRRDAQGRIVKKDDHLMDCERGLIMSGLSVAKATPVVRPPREPHTMPRGSWMG